MKIAIVCDWLVTYAGAERVLEQIIKLYPASDLYCVVDFLEGEDRKFLQGKKPRTTFIQNLPKAKTYYRSYLPFMPLAIEQIDLSGYDLIISSSHAVAKGVITGPDQVHISYVHSPMRYAWDLQHQYIKEAKLDKGIKSYIARVILHYMRLWDQRTSNSVDHYIANSRFIARRIKKIYGKEATVIYPPVDVEAFECLEEKEDYYLTASRLVPYKKVKLIVEAFNEMPEKQLIVIGDGPERKAIEAIAGKNIEMLGYQPFKVLKEKMQKAKAFVFAAEEDFGITPVEAQACGTPVIAYGKGGVLETVQGLEKKNATGVFFFRQEKDSIREAVQLFEEVLYSIKNENCKKNAEIYNIDRFQKELMNHIKEYGNLKWKVKS